ncbi:heat-labile enterotoxin alpha chain domain-containing protein [Hirsutella rhossiliensis]|uniref:Heat-labile enterotoxin alpha chain domain-containing protein n=1 Tax=Hirsutella rhossiliensis TaxID=111463 RepID=A0A9P8N3X6_9HYPO|nr:heat-labile enterotoxin alpha chain domain-containing protein [Hirsutella rhossiliensis]KAH0965384.1 heat-labile enterotoxin alpha chain domain-containing protein [Hirsutella rhossiliensis]
MFLNPRYICLTLLLHWTPTLLGQRDAFGGRNGEQFINSISNWINPAPRPVEDPAKVKDWGRASDLLSQVGAAKTEIDELQKSLAGLADAHGQGLSNSKISDILSRSNAAITGARSAASKADNATSEIAGLDEVTYDLRSTFSSAKNTRTEIMNTSTSVILDGYLIPIRVLADLIKEARAKVEKKPGDKNTQELLRTAEERLKMVDSLVSELIEECDLADETAKTRNKDNVPSFPKSDAEQALKEEKEIAKADFEEAQMAAPKKMGGYRHGQDGFGKGGEEEKILLIFMRFSRFVLHPSLRPASPSLGLQVVERTRNLWNTAKFAEQAIQWLKQSSDELDGQKKAKAIKRFNRIAENAYFYLDIVFPGGPSAQPKQKQIYEKLEDGRLCYGKLPLNRRLQAYGVPEKERQKLGLPTRNTDKIPDEDRECYQPQQLSDLALRYAFSEEVRRTLGISETTPTSVGPTETSSTTVPNPRSPEKPLTVYRGDSRSPEEIQALGGIPPRFAGETTNQSYSLKAHHEAADKNIATRYTSTTRSFGVATVYATGLYHGGTNKDGWVYRIHPTPNMIDLNASNFTAVSCVPYRVIAEVINALRRV